MTDQTTGAKPDITEMPNEWWKALQNQAAEHVQKTGTTAGMPAADPAVLVTVIGAKTGTPRQVPLLRIEHDGQYVIAASKRGSSREPLWARNVRANPNVTLQDGEVTRRFTAREVAGRERAIWWERAVAAQPAMKGYAAATDRVIPLFVLDPAW
jgi:deazaflavin-dependent oxidoreductase (nitroreductase family)